MKIGIIGAGNMDRALAKASVRACHVVRAGMEIGPPPVPAP